MTGTQPSGVGGAAAAGRPRSVQGRLGTGGATAAALTQHRVPLLFVSGYGKEGLPAAFSRAPVVTKPFTPVQLLEATERLTPPSADVLVLKR